MTVFRFDVLWRLALRAAGDVPHALFVAVCFVLIAAQEWQVMFKIGRLCLIVFAALFMLRICRASYLIWRLGRILSKGRAK